MYRDNVIEEIRKIRDEYAREFNYDLEAMYRDVKKKEQENGRELVSFPARRFKREVVAKA